MKLFTVLLFSHIQRFKNIDLYRFISLKLYPKNVRDIDLAAKLLLQELGKVYHVLVNNINIDYILLDHSESK